MIFLGQRSTCQLSRWAITAGIALAYRLSGHLPDQARSILIDASTQDRLPAVAGWDRALRGFVMLALQRLKHS